MRRYQILAGFLFAALGIFLMTQGVKLKLAGDFGPGPGFMPFLVGILLVTTCTGWALQTAFAPSAPFAADALPEEGGAVRVIAVSAALLLFAAVFEAVGFRMSMFVFLIVVPFVFGRDHAPLKIALSIVFSFGLFALFERVLRVPLPASSIDALAAIGL